MEEQQTVCTNCGIVIRWLPTVVDGKPYCCLGCAQGGPCECDYDNLPEPGDAKAMVLRTPPETPGGVAG
jgi:hypothetical protein